MPSTRWFGRGISYDFKIIDDKDQHGDVTPMDFDCWGDLQREIKRMLREFTCPACGGQQVTGSGVIVTCGKVRLFRHQTVKGWFGGTKHKDEFLKKVWRVHDVSLRVAPGRHIFNFFAVLDDPPGEVKCESRGCTWADNGGREGTQTLGQFLKRLQA